MRSSKLSSRVRTIPSLRCRLGGSSIGHGQSRDFRESSDQYFFPDRVWEACSEVRKGNFPFPDSWADNDTKETLLKLENWSGIKPDQVCPFDNIALHNVSQDGESVRASTSKSRAILFRRVNEPDYTTYFYSAQRLALS